MRTQRRTLRMARAGVTLFASVALVLSAGLLTSGEAGVGGGGLGIDLEKLVNGVDADSAPGPSVAVGSIVTFTYQLRIAGIGAGAPLSIFTFLDDNGTPGNFGDDFTPAFTGGDVIPNNQLDLGETWTYTATRTAILGQYENFASVSAFTSNFSQVSDSDAGHYLGVAVPEPGSMLLLGLGVTGLAFRLGRQHD